MSFSDGAHLRPGAYLSNEEIGRRVVEWMRAVADADAELARLDQVEMDKVTAQGARVVDCVPQPDGSVHVVDVVTGEIRGRSTQPADGYWSNVWDPTWIEQGEVWERASALAPDHPEPPFKWLCGDEPEKMLASIGRGPIPLPGRPDARR